MAVVRLRDGQKVDVDGAPEDALDVFYDEVCIPLIKEHFFSKEGDDLLEKRLRSEAEDYVQQLPSSLLVDMCAELLTLAMQVKFLLRLHIASDRQLKRMRKEGKGQAGSPCKDGIRIPVHLKSGKKAVLRGEPDEIDSLVSSIIKDASVKARRDRNSWGKINVLVKGEVENIVSQVPSNHIAVLAARVLLQLVKERMAVFVQEPEEDKEQPDSSLEQRIGGR
jgi:SNF2 family DNA or RNA helicase